VSQIVIVIAAVSATLVLALALSEWLVRRKRSGASD
jgi:hypothetical protein